MNPPNTTHANGNTHAEATLRPARGVSLWAKGWHRLAKNRVALGGLVFLILVGLACAVGPFIVPQSPHAQDLALGATGPSAAHWLGTDVLGRDLLARLLQGGRISFAVGLLATAVALTIGVTYGMVSGYVGGRVDRVMMRCVEILYSLPFTVFVILLMVFFGRKLWLIFIAIGAVEWLPMARIVRGQVLVLKAQQFVEAARALGQRPAGILWRHLLPNLLGTILVYATLTVPSVMLLESFLSFLGLGVQPPDTSWGDLIKEGSLVMEEHPSLLLFPSLVFSATLFSLNFLGDGLRDAFDPRADKEA